MTLEVRLRLCLYGIERLENIEDVCAISETWTVEGPKNAGIVKQTDAATVYSVITLCRG